MEVKFKALVKKITSKALVSLDKSYQVLLESGDEKTSELIKAPADRETEVTIKW